MKTKTHPIEQEELMAYLDGELPADRAAVAAAHLEQCSECQKLASGLKSVAQRLMDWQVEAHDAKMSPAVNVAIGEVKLRRWRDWLRIGEFAPWAVGFAACLLVVLGVRFIGTNSNTVFSQVGSAMQDDSPSPKGGATKSTRGYFGTSEVSSSKPRSTTRAQLTEGLVLPPPPPKDATSPSVAGPMVIRTAALALAVQEFDKARTSLEDILKRHRGYVGDLQATSPPGDGRTLKATLRVPADQLDTTLAELKKLGRVESEVQNGEEVTAQYVDLEARLANSRNTEQRLTDVLKQRTGKLSDVLEVETEIARVRGEIESREAQRKSMANQVAFATLTATLTEDYKPKLQAVPPSTLMKFRNSAVEGYRSMMEGVVGLVIFVLSYGPSVLLWLALLFFPARFAWRRLAASAAR